MIDGGAFLAQKKLLKRVIEVTSIEKGRLVRRLTETVKDRRPRLKILRTQRVPLRRSSRLQLAATSHPPPVFSLGPLAAVGEEDDDGWWAPTASRVIAAVVEWGPQTSTYWASTYQKVDEGGSCREAKGRCQTA